MATVKKVLKILTYLQVIAALAAIGLAIYLLVSVYLLAEAVAIILLCLGIALLVFSLFGVIGLQRKSKFCLCLYQIGIIPLTLAALGLGIGASIYRGELFNDGNNQLLPNQQNCRYFASYPYNADCRFGYTGKTQQIMSELSDTEQQALCWLGRADCGFLTASQTAGCSVNVPSQTLTAFLQSQGLTVFNNNNGQIDALGCSTQIDKTPNNGNFQMYAAFLQYIEGEHSCSGVAYTVPYYVFQDINKTPSKSDYPQDQGVNQNCYNYIQDTIKSWFTVALVTSFIVFSFLLLNVVLSMYVCFSKRHNLDQQDVYTRMNFYED